MENQRLDSRLKVRYSQLMLSILKGKEIHYPVDTKLQDGSIQVSCESENDNPNKVHG